MNRNVARPGSPSTMAVAIASAALLMLASPASTLAQRHPRGGGSGQSTGSAQPRGSGGDSSSGRSSGGTTRSGGSGQTQSQAGSGRSSGEQSRGSGGSTTRSGPRSVSPRGERSGDGGSRDGDTSGGPVRGRSGGTDTRATGSERGSTADEAPPPGGRTREGNATGRAVARRPGTGDGGRTVIITDRGYYGGGFYPWGYGGLGFGGYYGGYYDPWWYNDDPGYGYSDGYGYGYDGALRLKMRPREAAVYVDGYYAGRVDDFDGVFQRLRVESGPHRIEVRLDGFEPLMFELRIQPDRTITYKGDLKELP